MLTKALLIILSAFCSGMLFLFFLQRVSLKRKIFVLKGIPLVGGPALAGAFIFSTLCFGMVSREIYGILLASLVMLIFGLIDDWRELSIAAKFCVQIMAALILIFCGVRTNIVYIGNIANIIITLIWILAITNALNHLDVMDGVAATVAMTVSLGFLIVAFLPTLAFLSIIAPQISEPSPMPTAMFLPEASILS